MRIYLKKLLSVLCPVIFIIVIAGTSAKYKFVAKLRLAVWVVIKLYFSVVFLSIIPPRVIELMIISFISASSPTFFRNSFIFWLLIGAGILPSYFSKISFTNGWTGITTSSLVF